MERKKEPEEIKRRLDEARNRGSRAWTEVKAGLNSAWKELKEATERARRHFEN